jgi:enoyl-[acyl-carrier protein] reductase/trans-2-enoyl-CoA reductase (NAD+)
MRDDVQDAVLGPWANVTTGNLNELTDFAGYQAEFLKLFGFGLPGVDYTAESDPGVGPASLAE